MRRIPKTLFGQMLLVFFSGLLLVQLIGMWLMLDDRSRLNYKLLAEYAAQRTAGIASVLDHADAYERARLASSLSVPPTTLTMDVPWSRGPLDSSDGARAFAAAVEQGLARPLSVQVLSVEQISPEQLDFDAHGREFHRSGHGPRVGERKAPLFARTFLAQVRLHDGTVVTFHQMLPQIAQDVPYRMIALLLLLLLSVGLLSGWAVRRLTRPLAGFANAAAGLAQNLDQPPLMENGPLEVRRATQAFNAMQRDLRRYLATRSQALSGVSHDLRLPITRLRLRLEEVDSPSLRRKMEHDLSEMDDMIGHTLDFLRAGSDAETPVMLNLDALIDSVIEDMEDLGAHIERTGAVRQPLRLRANAMRRCIANLLDNARRYGGEGLIRVTVEDSATEIAIRIDDQGPGIAAADREQVFEPYVRLESSRARHTGGTGLGLAISKAVLESHGGRIELGDAPGGGLRVSLTLPRAG
ncbi:ATP-binding protein [Paludibacterium yongneupense]|uniref:ATP-binding protein n=1 Tax=Paludibacterium yongneupense TaxID=400061 RepID=UPI0003F66D62|nr:ATP-binding protein [Paludibacterium yongneupense]